MKKFLTARHNNGGFTLVELIIVIAVIAILVGILMPSFSGVVDMADKKAFLASCREDLADKLQQAEGDYYSLYADNATGAEDITATNDTSAKTITYVNAGLNLKVVFNYGNGAQGWGEVETHSAG